MNKSAVGVVAAANGNGSSSSSSSSPSFDTSLSLSTRILHPQKVFTDPYNALSTPLYQVSYLMQKIRNKC